MELVAIDDSVSPTNCGPDNDSGKSVGDCDLMRIYQLIDATINGTIPIETLIERLKSYSTLVASNDFEDVLPDALVLLDIETSIIKQEHREKLLVCIRRLIKDGILPNNLALERFEMDTCAQLGIIADKKQFMVSYNRLRTKLYFKQKKYNLLREENLGFAKILTELSQIDSASIEQSLANIIYITGQYRVDPNRVLDLILEKFEFDGGANCDTYIKFLQSYYGCPKKVTQVVLLKLSFYAKQKDSKHSKPIMVPYSFYRLIAILLRYEILDLDDIYPSLVPSDAKILDYHKKLVEEAKAYSRKYAMLVLGEEKLAKSVLEDLNEEDRYQLEVDNQKVNICAHLMDLGDWDRAMEIVRKLPEYYCIAYSRVATSACDFISYLIDPIYRESALTKPLRTRITPIRPRTSPSQINSIEELRSIVFPKLRALGPFISVDTLLLTKIIRLFRHILVSKDENDKNLLETQGPLYNEILDLINETILPSISLSGSNCCLTREVWTLLKNFKYHIRYKLYYNWREEVSNPAVLRARGQILLLAKHHMKRLSKESLRFSARHIGKLCYSNPVITMSYILVQIQSYENLISLVVDAFRYIPPLALDAAIYCIIEALSDPNKNKKSMDGLAVAQWLTNLSAFSSNIILRYNVDFLGFIDYIVNQIRVGSSLDLIVLTDLIQKMAGIETLQTITEDRLEALSGGDILRTEYAYFNQIKNTRKSSARLKDVLLECRHAMTLCIHMAQLRDNLFFKQDGTHLKLTGNLYDQCQETFVQYGVFLSMNLSIDNYINFAPSLELLLTEYKLDPDSAFFLARPMILHKIKSKFLELKKVAAKDIVAEEGEALELDQEVLVTCFNEAARSVIDPIADAIKPSLIEKYGTANLNPKLFVIFWTLSIGDIDTPVACYDREIAKLAASLVDKSDDAADPRKQRDQKKAKERHLSLIQERDEQIGHATLIKTYIESEKTSLFCGKSDNDEKDIYLESRQFVQHCAFARSTLTACDAIYSARFLLFLHELQIKNYSTLICLDRLLCDLTYMMGACTENEAQHYGRFLRNILKTTAHWHSDSEIYKAECEHFPGSIINMETSEHISYENYRHICNKWHYRLTRAFTVALESNNYIQIRNALIVMTKIIDFYPAIKHFGKAIGIKIEEVRSNEKDSRYDLYALATAYAGKLDEKRPELIQESDFHIVESAPSTGRKKARHA